MANLDLEALGITPGEDSSEDIVPSNQTQNPQGVNLDALGISGGLDTISETTEEIIHQGTGVNLDALGITVETRGQQGELRTEIEQTASPEFSAENLEVFQEFMSEHADEVNRVLGQIETAMQEASEMTLSELTQAHQGITLEGDFAEAGTQIETDVARILGLSDGEEISITRGEQDLIFESKEEALLYLYEEKVSLYYIFQFLTQLETDEEKPVLLTDEVEGQAESSSAWHIAYAILGIGSVYAIWNTRRNYRLRGKARALDTISVDGNNYTQQDIRNMMYEVLQGSPNREDQIKRLTGNNNFWVELQRLERTSGEGLGGRIFLLHGSNFYRGFQESLVRRLVEAQRVRQQVIAHFNDINIGGIDFIHAEAIIGLDHDVPNSEEFRLSQELRILQRNILNGNLDYIFGMNFDDAIMYIRQKILTIAKNGSSALPVDVHLTLGDNISTQGSAAELLLHDVANYPRLTNINTYESMLAAREVRANLDGFNFDRDNTYIELQRFFNSIGNTGSSQHRYTYYSASAIIERILDGSSFEDALRDSMPPSGENGDTVRARITDATYLDRRISSYIRTVIRDLDIRLSTLRYADEIQAFRDQFIDHIVRNGNYLPGFENFGTRAERRLTEIQGNLRPSPHNPNRIERFLTTPVFESDNRTLTPHAQLIFDANIAGWVLEGKTLSESDIQSMRASLENGNITNMGELLDRLESHPQSGSILRTPEEADRLMGRFYQAQAEDIVERFRLDQTGVLNGYYHTNIVRNADGSMRVEVVSRQSLEGAYQYISQDFTVTSIEDFQNQFIMYYADSTYNLPSATELRSRGISIDISRFQSRSILRNIDTFLRRAR